MEFSKELIDQARACKTADEIRTFAKENEIELTEEDAEILLNEFQEGELDDVELDNVVGGAEGCKKSRAYEDVYWEKEEDVQFIFKDGDIVECLWIWQHHTITCKIVNTRIFYNSTNNKYCDEYWVEKVPGAKAAFIKCWVQRHQIEK